MFQVWDYTAVEHVCEGEEAQGYHMSPMRRSMAPQLSFTPRSEEEAGRICQEIHERPSTQGGGEREDAGSQATPAREAEEERRSPPLDGQSKTDGDSIQRRKMRLLRLSRLRGGVRLSPPRSEDQEWLWESGAKVSLEMGAVS